MTLPDSEILNNIVSRVFRYDDVTLGDPNRGYFLRYRGRLLRDSVEAYDQLAEALRPYDITPLFRLEEERTYTTRDRESALLRYFVGNGT